MGYWTMDVVIDPWDAAQNTWYAGVFSGWGNAQSVGVGGVYRTTNRGVSWTKITTGIDRAYSVTCDPVHQGAAYMTTETQGLWYTSNIAATIPVWTQVAGYPFRQPNRVYFNPYNQNQIWVNSFGNGIRMGDLTTDLNEITSSLNRINIFPNPTKGDLTVDFLIQENTSLTIKLSNINGQIMESNNSKETAGPYKHIYNLNNYSKGVYFITFTTDKETYTKKVIVE